MNFISVFRKSYLAVLSLFKKLDQNRAFGPNPIYHATAPKFSHKQYKHTNTEGEINSLTNTFDIY